MAKTKRVLKKYGIFEVTLHAFSMRGAIERAIHKNKYRQAKYCSH